MMVRNDVMRETKCDVQATSDESQQTAVVSVHHMQTTQRWLW